MSIVEKALQKAQAKAEQKAAERSAGEQAARGHEPPPAFTEEPVSQSIPPPAAAFPVEAARGEQVTLDLDKLRLDGRLAPAGLAYRSEEEFRRVKWPVLDAIAGREGAPAALNNVVLVTSAIPGEGKTYTALNLALSISRERDLEVLLIDGDLTQPSLTAAVGLGGRPGLTELLGNRNMGVADVVYPTNIEGLSLVPAGSARDNSPELLASEQMKVVIEALAARVSPGVVIFDSPPVLATNEAQVLSRYAGQVLLVIRSDHTEQRLVTEALGLIDRNRPVNAVLNHVEPSLLSRYYSYYYYGYGGKGARA